MNENRTIKNIILKVISLGISFIVTILVTRIVVVSIGNETYGYYSMSNDFINYAMIISIALNSMSSRYITVFYYKKSFLEVNIFFNSIFFANLILVLCLIVPILIIVMQLEDIINIPVELTNDIKILFFLMFLNFLFTIFSSVFTVSTFIKNRVDLDSLRSIESNILKIVTLFFLFSFLKPRIWFLGVGTLISTMYVFIVNIYYVRVLTPEISILKKRYFNIHYVFTVVKSGIWNSITRIGAILLNGLDLILANLYISTNAMGILSVSKTLPKLIINAISSFASVFTPKITIEYAKGEKEQLLYSICQGIEICALAAIIIQTIVIVLGESIYLLWVPNQDSNQIYILTIISMLGYLILMPFECLYVIFTITDKVKISSIYLITESLLTIAIVLISLNVFSEQFIRLIFITGVSSFIEIIRGLIFLPLYSAHCLKISKKTFYKPLIKIMLSYLIIIPIGFYINLNLNIFSVLWLDMLVKSLILSILVVIVWWFIIVNKRSRELYWKRYLKG